MQVGLADAAVLQNKIHSFGDPRLYALSVVTEHLSRSMQPLVPERLFVGGADGKPQTGGMLGLLVDLLVAEKAGWQPAEVEPAAGLKDLAASMTHDGIESLQTDRVKP